MKSILELFAQDEIQVNSRGYQYSNECLKTYEMLEELEKKINEKLGDEQKFLQTNTHGYYQKRKNDRRNNSYRICVVSTDRINNSGGNPAGNRHQYFWHNPGGLCAFPNWYWQSEISHSYPIVNIESYQRAGFNKKIEKANCNSKLCQNVQIPLFFC